MDIKFTMFFQLFVLFTAALLPTVLAVTPYTLCAIEEKVEISDFMVNDCQSSPCDVNWGGTLGAFLNLAVLQQIGTGGTQLYIRFEAFIETFLGPIPIITTTDPLCGSELQCPVPAGTIYSLTKELELESIIIRSNYRLKLSVLEGANTIMCLEVNIRVV